MRYLDGLGRSQWDAPLDLVQTRAAKNMEVDPMACVPTAASVGDVDSREPV